MKREILSESERAEYDALMWDAGYDPAGKRRPSSEVGPRVHDLLLDAAKAGRPWATWVLEDDAAAAHLSRFKRWANSRITVTTPVGDRMVKRSAAMSVKRSDPVTGADFWQPTFWADMTHADLLAVQSGARGRIESERITLSIVKALDAILTETGCTTVAEALAHKGTTIEAWLAQAAGAA